MDLHRLRVVEFDTSVKEKEREKKHNAELVKRKEEERITSTIENGDQIGDEHQCLYEHTIPPGLLKKCLTEEIRPLGTLKKYAGDSFSPPGTIKICVNDDRTPPRTSKQCLDDELFPPRTSKKYINDIATTSHLGTPQTQRSKSEMFKISHKKQLRKRPIKTNSSDIGLTKRFQASEYSHQKKRTLNLRNKSKHSRIHHKEKNVKEKKEKSEEVHFLFAREKPSVIRYRRKRTYNERTKIRDSKSPNDIYGFQTSHRSLNQNQYQMSHFNFIDTDNLPFKKIRVGFHRKRKPPQPVTHSFCKYHAMRVLNSAYGNGDSRPIYYNLGYHPHPPRYLQKQRCDQEEGLKNERSHCMAKDEIVEVSLSSFSPVSKSYHDARTGPSKVELTAGSHQPLSLLENSTTLQNFTVASEYNQKSCPLSSTPSPYAACAAPADNHPCGLKKSQTLQDVTRVGNQKPCALPSTPTPCSLCAARAQHKCKKKRKKTKKTFLILSLCHGFLSKIVKLVTDFHTRNKLSGKSCIKYVVFGLLIVVCSPCLLAVILVWVVMFPWKITNILKTDVTAKRSFAFNNSFKRFRKNNLRREYQQICFENCSPGKKSSFMTSAAIWISRTAGVVVNSFNAVISLLKLKKKAPTRACSSFLSSCHPNPRKRYKLFYADNRGWVMKPLRRRTRSCARNRVVQSMRCELRPKYCQKVRGQASLKKVPCPVHGTDLTDPIHQSSPAGDACLARSRNPRCSCICKDKYSQCPSAFMPLHSHHLRQKQVNIPPKFYNTTSATTSFPTEKIKNIAYKNLAKNHLRQRKYGALAIGIASNILNKHDVGDTSTDITNHLPSCGLNRLGRQTAKREMPLKGLTARSHKLVIANKNSTSLQKKIYFDNLLTDIFQSALTKHAETSTNKVNYALTTQNTSKHIPYQKVTNKPKTAKARAEMASKRVRDAKFLPPKQTYTYKTRAPTQKHPSSAKIKSNIKHDITVNYSFGNKRKQCEQGYKHKPEDLVSVKTQMLSNTADTTTMTNRDVALNCFCRKEHKIFKYGYEHKPHKISAATQKKLCTADITTSTNRNVALNCAREKDHGRMSKHIDKNKPHQIPIATQMQSRTADTATSTKHNMALNFPCEEKRKPSKHGYQHIPRKIPVATQMQLKTVDITTSMNRNVATNCPREEKYKPSEQGYKHKPHQILVATQKQSKTAENATDTNRDLALNGTCEEGHEPSQHGYKHKLPVATQMQQRTTDNATDTNRDVALNYHGGAMPSTANKEKLCFAKDKEKQNIQEMILSKPVYKYTPGQIPVATQKQSNTADITTITNGSIALNYPYRDKHEKSELAYKRKPDHIRVGVKKRPSKANIMTSTEYIGSDTQSTPNKSKRRTYNPSTFDKDTICTQKTNTPEYLSKNQDISIQKHSYKIDASINCISDYEKRKNDEFFISEQAMLPNKTVDCTKATTSSKKTAPYKGTQTIAYSTLKGEIDTERPKRVSSKEIVNCGCRTKLTQIATAAQFPLAYNTNTHKTSSAEEPQIKQSKLPQAPPHTVQEEPKLFGIAPNCTCGTNQQNLAKKSSNKNISIEQPKVLKESRQYGSQKTLEIDTQGLTPGSVTAHARKTRITNESPPTSTDIQELLCDCECECNSVPPLKSKLPRYFPSAQPDFSNKNKTLSKFPHSPAHLPFKLSQKSSPLFVMPSKCRCCEVPPINEPSKHPNLIQALSRTLQEQSKFVIASDCTRGTNQTTTAEKNLIKNVTIPKSTTAKEKKSDSRPAFAISKFSKSPEHSSLPCKCCYKSLPRKCQCLAGSQQNSVDQQQYGSKDSSTSSEKNIVKVFMPQSKFIKSAERTRPPKYLYRKCRFSVESVQDSLGKPPYGNKLRETKRTLVRVDKIPKSSEHTLCPVEGLQVPVRKQSAGIKVNKTFSKINSVKIDKTGATFLKLSEHTPPQKYLHHDCTCPVKNLQDPVGKKTSHRKSVFSRKSKRTPPDECPCFFSQNDVNKISFKSDVPVNWNTTKRFFIRPRGSTCSVNEPNCHVQSSRISQYSSKVSSLVMSLRSKLFSRKSKQITSKVLENPTKKLLPVILCSLQTKLKKADKTAMSIDNILESQLDDETNQSRFQRSHNSKTSQNPSLSFHSNHSSCSCLIHKKYSRRCTKKNQNVPKLLTVDKTYSCSHNVTKSIIVDPQVSQSIISQQSIISEQSSTITLFTRKSHLKSQSAQKQSSKKFDPQYTSTLINCQPTPTVRQTVRSQLPPSPKQSCLFNRPHSKLFLEKIRSITDTLKDKQVSTPDVQTALIHPSKCACSPEQLLHLSKKISSYSVEGATVRQPQVADQSFHLRSTQQNIPKIDSFHHSYPPKLLKVKKQFEVLPHQLKAEKVIPIISGSCTCAEDLKTTKEYLSNRKQFQAIPQPPKAAQVIPIISGRCTYAGEQNDKLLRQPNTNSTPLGNEKLPEFLQRLANQTLNSPAPQRHSSHQTGIPVKAPLCHFQSTYTKPCKCGSFKHGKEHQVSNSLHKIVKNRRLQEKFHKSHLISHVCTCSATTRRSREHIVHHSEISRSSGIQPSPQIQIFYEQNLPDQKRLSKIPINVDKPEMLQQHSQGDGRKSTAKGEVRQPYPDFNRVSLRYPGRKSPPKQSLQIPGINGPPPAKNYRPAPGTTPPPNYACDPCNTQPPKRCLPKSPYDESALRCAYKRRPLRYTPPRQHLPKAAMLKKLKENNLRAAEAKRRKGILRTKSFFKCLRCLINKTEREVWPDDDICHPKWLKALKKKQKFLQKKQIKTNKSCWQLFAYFITLCCWSPFLWCAYLCCNVLCKCCS